MSETDTLIILSTIIILVVVSIMFTIYTFFLKKKSELIYNQKLKETFFESELANAQIEMKEQTLNYIGQELHDDLGQKLSVARMMSARAIAVGNLHDDDILPEINHLLGECIQDIRNLSKTFISESVMHFGLLDSLQKEILRIQKLNLIEIDFSTNRQDIDINSKHALIIFRMIQESVNNVLKHSNAKKLVIRLIDDPSLLDITIRDNGRGFSKEEGLTGSGLKNIANRAKLINADFAVKSSPGNGTVLKIKYKK